MGVSTHLITDQLQVSGLLGVNKPQTIAQILNGSKQGQLKDTTT